MLASKLQSASSAAMGPLMTVVHRASDEIVSELTITDSMSIGSGEDCKLRLGGDSVASLHCWLSFTGSQLMYTQISDSSAVESAVGQAIDANPQAVADYIGGKETAAKFLVGQVMKITKGQAKPDLVNRLVVKALKALKSTAPK